MGIVSDLFQGISGDVNANAANHAAQQDTGAINSLFGTEQGGINNILQQYFGQGGGASALSGLMSSLSGLQGSNMNNPYSSGAAGVASSLTNPSNPYMSGASTTAGQLQNFNGLKPQELAALQTSLGNSGMSTINTMRGQLGGTANPNATIAGLMGQNQQNTLNAGVQLGSEAAGQELSGLQSAGSLQSGLSGQYMGGQSDAGSLYSGLSGQNNQYQNMIYSNLLGSIGQQGSMVPTAIGGLNSMAGVYGNAAQGSAQTAQQDMQSSQQGFGNFFNALPALWGG